MFNAHMQIGIKSGQVEKVKVDLSKFQNEWFSPGSKIKIILWMILSTIFFHTVLPFPSFIKVFILKLFGAEIGTGVVIKPRVNIKFPWKLGVGNNSWIGEGVWIDNLDIVSIGDNCCLSQGCYLLTGNHNYRSSSFDLMISGIDVENEAWIGAKTIVCPGVKVHRGAVLTAGSVATKNLEPFGIYQGHPATKVKKRVIS